MPANLSDLNPDDVSAFESSIGQINGASLQQYGTLANPQAVLDALGTGSTDLLNQTIGQGSPEYASMLSANPVAQPLPSRVSPSVAPNLAADPTNQAVFGDPKQLIAQSLDLGRRDSDPGIKQIGEAPLMNVSWYQDLVSSGDNARVSKWQTFLKSRHFLGSDYTPSGAWDSTSRQAMTSYLIARYAPDAMFGNNQEQARVFLQALGMDTQALLKTIGKDPTTRQDVFLKWLNTGNPDQARDAINTYIGKYGKDAVPEKYQQLSGHWWDGPMDALESFPVLGTAVSVVQNTLEPWKLNTASDIFQKGSVNDAQFLMRDFTDNEKEALQGVVDQSKHSVGWFGALDAWERAKNRALAGTFWMFHDGSFNLGDLAGYITNNYDSSTSVGKHVNAEENDIFADVPWLKDHDTLRAIAGFTANMLDDPLTYVGPGVVMKEVGNGLRIADKALGAESRLANSTYRQLYRPFTARDILTPTYTERSMADIGKELSEISGRKVTITGNSTISRMAAGFKQRAAKTDLAREALGEVFVSEANARAMDEMAHVMAHADINASDIALLLGKWSRDPDAMTEVRSIMQMKGNKAGILELLQKNHGWKGMLDVSFHHAYSEATKSLSPVFRARLSAGKLQRMMAHGSYTMSSPIIDLDNEVHVLQQLQTISRALGMDQATENRYINDLAKLKKGDRDGRVTVIDDFFTKAKEHFNSSPHFKHITYADKAGWDGFEQWQRDVRGLTNVPREAGAREFFMGKDAAGKVAEKSMVPRNLPPSVQRHVDELNSRINTLERHLGVQTAERAAPSMGGAVTAQEAVTHAEKSLLDDTPERARQMRELEDLKQARDDLTISRPGPMDTNQLMKHYSLPITPAEIIAYSNSKLRRAEHIQSGLKLDHLRSMWVQAVLARPSTAIRITLGDEVSRFFFHMLLNGHPVAAFRYLGTQMTPWMGVGKAARAVNRKVGKGDGNFREGSTAGALFNERKIPPEMAVQLVEWAHLGARNNVLHLAADHPDYARGMVNQLNSLSKGELTRTWTKHWAGNLDLHDRLTKAEGLWNKDRAAAEAELGKIVEESHARGVDITEHVKTAVASHADAVKRRSEAGMKRGMAQESLPELRTVAARFQDQSPEHRRIQQLIKNAEQTRNPSDIDALEGALKAHPDAMADYERAPLRRAGIPLSLKQARDAYRHFDEEKTKAHLGSQLMATEELRDAAAAAVQSGSLENARALTDVPGLQDLFAHVKRWDTSGDERHHWSLIQEMADLSNPQIRSLRSLRRANSIVDPARNSASAFAHPKVPIETKRGVLMDYQRGINYARSVDELNALEARLREIDPELPGSGSSLDLEKRKDAMQEQATKYAAQIDTLSDPNKYQHMLADSKVDLFHDAMKSYTMDEPKVLRHLHAATQLDHSDQEAVRQWALDTQNSIQKIKDKGGPTMANLPVITSPLKADEGSLFANPHRTWGDIARGGMNWFHDHLTQRMVNYARYTGMEELARISTRRIKKMHPEWSDAEASTQAWNHAWAWIEKNTYQGQRTAMGSVLRNVFPFWGATANMSRFWMRQLQMHPHSQMAFITGLSGVDQAQAKGGLHVSVPYLNQAVSRVLRDHGDDVSFDPLRPFFFTADGVGGFTPGLGPVFSYGLDAAASHDPDIVNAALGAFGPLGDVYKQHLNANVDAPFLGWTSGTLGGLYEVATGHATPQLPFITQPGEQKKIDEQARQDQGSDPTITDQAGEELSAGRKTGVKNLLTGASSFLAPVGTKIADQRKEDLSHLTSFLNQHPTEDAKNTVYAKEFGVSTQQIQDAIQQGKIADLAIKHPDSPALLTLYYDRRINEDDKRSISFAAPWVTSYGTSMYETKDTGEISSTNKEFQDSLASGDEHLLGVKEYLKQVAKNREFNTAYYEYGRLKQAEYAFYARTGVASQSKEAAAWRAAYFNPTFEQLQQRYPNWAQQFLSQSRKDIPGLTVATKPLKSLAAWEVIPEFDNLNSKKVEAWRGILVAKDNAATALRELRQSGVTGTALKNQEQQLLDELASHLRDLAQKDPSVASELDQFHFGRVEDLVNLESEI